MVIWLTPPPQLSTWFMDDLYENGQDEGMPNIQRLSLGISRIKHCHKHSIEISNTELTRHGEHILSKKSTPTTKAKNYHVWKYAYAIRQKNSHINSSKRFEK